MKVIQKVWQQAAALLCSAVFVGFSSCSGGASGGNEETQRSFTLEDVSFGRFVAGDREAKVVNPWTTIDFDPETLAEKPDTLRLLRVEETLEQRPTLGIGRDSLPRVIPRNAALVLKFSRRIDPRSVPRKSNGKSEAPCFIRYRNGDIIPTELTVQNDELWIRAGRALQHAFPASPPSVDAEGHPQFDPFGHLELVLAGGVHALKASNGTALQPRVDGLGSKANPIGFNPGNRLTGLPDLHEWTFADGERIAFREQSLGFLPDAQSPRIVRTHRFEHVLNTNAGDRATVSSIQSNAFGFSARAREGLGEWSGCRLILRPDGDQSEIRRVAYNRRDEIFLEAAFSAVPAAGDRIRLERIELFEPDPDHPIDPARFDPDNPENFRNSKLVNFIEVYEIDATGTPIGEAGTLREPVPAFSELRIRFSEPLHVETLSPWENFRVTHRPFGGEGDEMLTRIRANERGDVIAIQPAFTDPESGKVRVISWGPGVQSLELGLTAVIPFRLWNGADPKAYAEFLDQGILSIRDLGGQPLAVSPVSYDSETPHVVYREGFVSDEALGSRPSPPVAEDWGVMVHRFQGRPSRGIEPNLERDGMRFGDRDTYYFPAAEVNPSSYGALSVSPVVSVRKVHDDTNPPADGPLQISNFGAGTPLVTPLRSFDLPPYEHNGVRFQHVYRDTDASPGGDAQGMMLDLSRLSFAPAGGNVTSDIYEDISVHIAHSPIRPITALKQQVLSRAPKSGLSGLFDFATYYDLTVLGKNRCNVVDIPHGPNYYDDSFVTVVPPGTRWVISQNQRTWPNREHAYHPYPEFKKPFSFFNGETPPEHQHQRDELNELAKPLLGENPWKDSRVLTEDFDNRGGDSMLVEIRIRPQDAPISYRNSYAYAWGIQTSIFPNFRTFTVGRRGRPFFPDDEKRRNHCAHTPSWSTPPADNCRYFATFDYQKSTSRIASPYIRPYNIDPERVRYHSPIVVPDSSRLPRGTAIELMFQGANHVSGKKRTAPGPHPSIANGQRTIAFFATLRANPTTRLAPSIDLLAIPFER